MREQQIVSCQLQGKQETNMYRFQRRHNENRDGRRYPWMVYSICEPVLDHEHIVFKRHAQEC